MLVRSGLVLINGPFSCLRTSGPRVSTTGRHVNETVPWALILLTCSPHRRVTGPPGCLRWRARPPVTRPPRGPGLRSRGCPRAFAPLWPRCPPSSLARMLPTRVRAGTMAGSPSPFPDTADGAGGSASPQFGAPQNTAVSRWPAAPRWLHTPGGGRAHPNPTGSGGGHRADGVCTRVPVALRWPKLPRLENGTTTDCLSPRADAGRCV